MATMVKGHDGRLSNPGTAGVLGRMAMPQIVTGRERLVQRCAIIWLIAAGFITRGSAVSKETGLKSADLPSRCQSERVAENLVVAARYNEDISWMAVHLEVPFFVYQADDSKAHRYFRRHSNSAREGSAFLTFIAEYYDCLPEVTAFVHGHRSSWHSEDIVEDLHNLQWGNVDKYLPLSMSYFLEYGPWFMSYPASPEKHLATLPPDASENSTVGNYEILNGTMYASADVFHYKQARDVAIVWQNLLEPLGFGAIPEEIRYFCCGQFAVPSSKIRLLPREAYLQMIHWLEHTEHQMNVLPQYSKAIALETVWHTIFGEENILPDPDRREKCQLFFCQT